MPVIGLGSVSRNTTVLQTGSVLTSAILVLETACLLSRAYDIGIVGTDEGDCPGLFLAEGTR